MSSIGSSIDLTALHRLADPAKAAEAASAGIPTIDLSKFQNSLSTHLDVKNKELLNKTTNMAGNILSMADNLLEKHMSSIKDLAGSATGAIGSAAGAVGSVSGAAGAVSGAASSVGSTVGQASNLLGKGSTLAGKAFNTSVKAAMSQIANAKEVAIKTGNFFPLLKLTHPEMKLDGIPSDLINVDFKSVLGDSLKKLI